jgi:excisionase family DNA binding protein
MQGEDFYTVEEAARALKLTPDRIRQMLRDGEIEGVPPLEGGASGWKIPVRVVQDRDRPPPMVRPEAPAVGSESLPGPEDTSGPEDMRGEEAPSPTPAQPEREDAAVDSREPTKPPTPHISVREAARNLETSVEALLDAKDQTIADPRDRVALLERQLEGRSEEIRRRDHIFAALTERIPPALEAPDHEKPTRTPESTAEEPTRATPVRAGAAPRGPRRPWWHRAFGR